MRRSALVLLVPLLLGGCSFFNHDKPRPVALYSPNGEPLSGGPLGHPTCADALGRWFDRLDGNHAGAIDAGVFLADARRQFAAMDLNKDGVITPAVLAQYRAPYAEPGAGLRLARSAADQDEEDSRRARAGRGRRTDDDGGIAQDLADPVMLADVRLRNRVTLDDFLAYARRNFVELDANHDGRLDKAELVATCGKNGGS